MQTYVINLIGGPGLGKTTMCAILFAELKLKGYNIEYVQEYAKHLVWTEQFEELNNQYHVSQQQYKLLSCIVGKTQIIITDGPLLNALYYNRNNKDNICDISKTEKFILDSYSKFNNINLFLERGDFKYEQAGRIQNETESREIDTIMKHIFRQNDISYNSIKPDVCKENISSIVALVESIMKNTSI